MDGYLRKAHILAGQYLTAPASCREVCHDLNGIQAQLASAAEHALRIRATDLPDELGAGFGKSWTLRGAMHLFALEDLPLFLHKGRKRALRPVDEMAEDEYITLERKQLFASAILEAIGMGVESRDALRAYCAQQGMTGQEAQSVFNSWGGTIRCLAEEGRLCYRPCREKAFQLCPPFEPMEAEATELEMARRYFTNYGPATLRDAAYFFGSTQKRARAWLDALPVKAACIEGRECFWIDRGQTRYADIPDCLLLAGFDQLMLGYEKKDSPFLPEEYLRGIFSLAGMVSPAILLHGSVAGRWKKTGGRVELTAFRTLKPTEQRKVLGAVERTFDDVKAVVWA